MRATLRGSVVGGLRPMRLPALFIASHLQLLTLLLLSLTSLGGNSINELVGVLILFRRPSSFSSLCSKICVVDRRWDPRARRVVEKETGRLASSGLCGLPRVSAFLQVPGCVVGA